MPEQRAGVLGLDLERLFEKILRHVGLPVFEIQAAPGDADSRRYPGNRRLTGGKSCWRPDTCEPSAGLSLVPEVLARSRRCAGRTRCRVENIASSAQTAARGRCFTCRSPPALWQAQQELRQLLFILVPPVSRPYCISTYRWPVRAAPSDRAAPAWPDLSRRRRWSPAAPR